MSGNVKLGRGYKFEGRTFFRSPRQTIQGERPSFSMMSFGFKKEFKNKRGSFGIGMIEPFSKYKSFDTSISGEMVNGDRFENNRDYEILFRSVNFSFKYNFGKIDFDPIKKKASLENNDLMEYLGHETRSGKMVINYMDFNDFINSDDGSNNGGSDSSDDGSRGGGAEERGRRSVAEETWQRRRRRRKRRRGGAEDRPFK